MGALSIAFDTIIVGALAVSWVALIVHLFFSRDKSGIKHLLDWVNEQNQPAVAGVLFFAIAFFLGSAVSRIAQDFFDDDDLHIQVGRTLYEAVTEDGIRASVYCGMSDEWFGLGNHFGERPLPLDCKMQGIMQLRIPMWFYLVQSTNLDSKDAVDAMRKMRERVLNIFHAQESALLLKGEDATERLRQLHDQINVLRGAAFDGLLAFSLCLFGWCAKFPRKVRWVLWLAPVFYLALGLIAFLHHLEDRALSEPPFMEFTLFVLGLAGCYVLGKDLPKKPAAQKERGMHQDRRVNTNLRAGFLILLLLFVATASLGWWTTEVLYDKQVVYSNYQAQKPPN
jgi:hypothetical protein